MEMIGESLVASLRAAGGTGANPRAGRLIDELWMEMLESVY